MSPGLRAGPVSQSRFAALGILVRVEQDRAFADIALEHALARARFEPRDAALCAEIVYGTLRWQRHLDWRLGPHLHRPLAKLDPWVRALLRLTAYQLLFLDRVPQWAAVDQAVSLAKLKSRKPGPADFVNAVLRSLSRVREAPPLPAPPGAAAAVRWSFPDWLAARWIERYGQEEAEALLAASNARPPVTLRTNTLRISREALRARLRDEELVEARPTRLAPEGLTVIRHDGSPSPRELTERFEPGPETARGGGRPFARWAAFAEGCCTVQDEGSMLIARLLEPRPGELVADTCAAPGTKTTHLAELMSNRGQILAMDPQPARLRLLGEAAARLGLTIIERHAGTVERLAPRWQGRCDRALVDAPCSNLGVLRRNPEVKWRRSEEDLRRLPHRQRAILAAAASLVKPGGWLVYATCSLEPEENEEVIRRFLESHAGWQPDPTGAFPVAADSRGMIRLLPHLHGTDGFTAVRLRRA